MTFRSKDLLLDKNNDHEFAIRNERRQHHQRLREVVITRSWMIFKWFKGVLTVAKAALGRIAAHLIWCCLACLQPLFAKSPLSIIRVSIVLDIQDGGLLKMSKVLLLAHNGQNPAR